MRIYERKEIERFTEEKLVFKHGAIRTMKQLYTSYQKWRDHRGMIPTKRSIDSFGKLFPKKYAKARGLVYVSGKLHRGLRGYVLQ